MVSHCVLTHASLPAAAQVTVRSQLSSLAAMPVFTVGAAAGSQIPMVLAWSTDDKWQDGEPRLLSSHYLLERFEKIVQVKDFIQRSQPLPLELV